MSRSGFSTKRSTSAASGAPVDHELAGLLHVAEADGRLGRRDADRADVALAGDGDRLLHGPVEHLRAADDVVGGERADDDVGLAARQDRRGQTDRGRRVARLGLEEHVLVGDAGQLLLDRRAVRAPGDDRDAVGTGERLEAIPRVAQERVAGAGEVVQELGCVGAGQRPQPAADSAGGDDGVEVLDGLRHAVERIRGGDPARFAQVSDMCTDFSRRRDTSGPPSVAAPPSRRSRMVRRPRIDPRRRETTSHRSGRTTVSATHA